MPDDDEWLRDVVASSSGLSGLGISGLVDAIVGQLASDRDAGRQAVFRGMLEGLRHPRGQLWWPDVLADDDTSLEQRRRAGVLCGRMLGTLTTRSTSDPFLSAAIGYAACLATPYAQRAVASADAAGLVKAHIYACALVERHGHVIAADDEIWLARWLFSQAEQPIDGATEAKIVRLRARRLERTSGRS